MIDIIYMKKSGLYTRFNKKFQKINRPISYYLHHSLKIEKGFTVAHLMQILKEYETDINLVFLAYTRGFYLAPYFTEMQKAVKKTKNPLIQLEFQWVGDIYNHSEFGKPKYEISDYVHIIGLKEKNNNPGWAIDLFPINEIKECTIKLNPKISFSNTDFGEKWLEDKKPITTNFFTGIKEFLLEDIIGSFLYEITFSGYPENKLEEIKELKARIVSFKKEKGILAEKVFLDFAKKSLKEEQKKKESKIGALRIEKLRQEIAFYKKKLKE